ncbi:MAG: PAS domain S-box protein [Smithella sp.]|jgi:PAS domain S-box-containing protein
MGENAASKISNQQSLRVLMIDDSENDVLLIIRELKKGGYNPVYERVETAVAMKKALKEKQWDIILCDYKMPNFNAFSAIAILKRANINVPLILISGAIGEETAVECMRLGAQDYIMKPNFSRLCPTIARELEETEVRNKKKLAEEALHHSEEKHRAILENIEEGYYEIDLKGNFIFFNDSMCRILGYKQEEMMGANSRQFTDKENARKLFKTFNEVYQTGKPAKGFDWLVTRKDGTQRYIEASVSLIKDSSNKPAGFRGIARDMTERKLMEDKLHQEEQRFRAFIEHSSDIIVVVDLTGTIIYINPAVEDVLGFKHEERIGHKGFELIHPDDHKFLVDSFTTLISNITPLVVRGEIHLRHKNGTYRTLEAVGSNWISNNVVQGIVLNYRDITESKRTGRTLKEKENRLRGITQNLPGIIFQFYAKDNNEFGISYVSERLTEFLGIKVKEDDPFSIFLSHVLEEDRSRFLTSIKTAMETGNSWNFEGRVAIQSGEIIWFQGLATPTRQKDKVIFDGILLDITERKQAEEKFHKIFMTSPDCIAITRMKDGLLIDVNMGFEEITGWKRSNAIGQTSYEINFWSNTTDRDFMVNELASGRDILHREFEFRRSDGSVRAGIYSARSINIDGETCLIFILQDVTEHKRMDTELQRTLDSLRKAFGTTIQVMISAIEMRDPYTAGHQKRCADIARAIATEMGFTQEKIDGIRMVGTIHDIGKLSIPAEILTKPIKLTKIEFSLIKEHSVSGYDMLKDIESPWPLAEIIYQHHERMNGSGYPRKLKGNEILIEARIMAVADVVEAMSSHRPYRAALGIEAALEEIEKNKGILYDNVVVDACLSLFREKGYKLP